MMERRRAPWRSDDGKRAAAASAVAARRRWTGRHDTVDVRDDSGHGSASVAAASAAAAQLKVL